MTYPEDWKPLVREAYSDLAPRQLDDPLDAAFARTVTAAEQLGWTITKRNPGGGTIEASDATAIFQFVDDVAIRIRPSGTGSILDIRSKSRDGRGDVGANAKRIRALLDAL